MENLTKTETITPENIHEKNLVTRQLQGFLEFVRTQGVIGFAIGFILGRAVSDLVGSFVSDIINPLIGLLTTRFGDLSQATWQLGSATLNYGKFLSLVINFILLAAIVYFIFKRLKLEKLDIPRK